MIQAKAPEVQTEIGERSRGTPEKAKEGVVVTSLYTEVSCRKLLCTRKIRELRVGENRECPQRLPKSVGRFLAAEKESKRLTQFGWQHRQVRAWNKKR